MFTRQLISACNSQIMGKIGAELPKISQNNTGYPFFGPPCSVIVLHICWPVKTQAEKIFITWTSHTFCSDLDFIRVH